MLRTSPFPRNICPFGDRSEDHDQRGNRTAKSHSRPAGSRSWRVVTLLFVMPSIESWRVESRIEPERGDVDDPNAIEVDQHMEPGSSLLVGLEEHLLPTDVLQFNVPFCRGDVHKTRLVFHH